MDREVAREFLEKAHIFLREAQECQHRGDYPVCVLHAAECIEFSLKAIARSLGVSYGREHDISGSLARAAAEFPDWFKAKLPRYALLSRTIVPLSIPARYGDEMLTAPARNLFSISDADWCLKSAQEIYGDCSRLFHEMLRRTT